MIRRLFSVISIVCTAAISSQAPEFAQQYRQRLGGAVDELQIIVSNFDNDASKLSLSRDQALQQLANAKQDFFQARASSMKTTINRYDSLFGQQNAFISLTPVLRPAALFTTYDEKIINGTWANYEPAAPLTLHGGIWTGIGAAFGWFLSLMVLKPFSKRGGRPNRRSKKRLRQTPSF